MIVMQPQFLRALVAPFAASVLAACSTGTAGPPPRVDEAAPAESLVRARSTPDLRVPSGYDIRKIASLNGPRVILPRPDGSMFVTLTGDDQLVLVAGSGGDGAYTVTQLLRNLDSPHGMVVHNGYLYIANTGAVVRSKLDGAGLPTRPLETVARYSHGGGHFTRSIVFGADGGMYVSIGSSCNLCEESAPDRASVMRFDADGRNGRVFARGLRNAVGMAVHPGTRAIWVSQHERDNLKPDHENLPPEEINILQDGGDYGWPYCHSDRVPNPEYHDQPRCDRTIAPALKMQAHSAPLGMTFLANATQVPVEWRGDLLLSFHGSWNRDTPTGAKVVRIRVSNNRPVSYEDFVVGWQTENGRRWGRPADVAVAADGAILIADDHGDAIWRMFRVR
ncbi:MAG: PQQ-dependent sugar dehydrogenase [Gemmatimonadaceae bacterium]|nr:PQQ-dependent sugar dehydrogenase [Gemmatimonadaceae bacterium]